MTVFSGVTSPPVFSYRCVLYCFLTLPVAFDFNLTYRLKPQVGSIKIVTVYRRSIFQVEWLMAPLIAVCMVSKKAMIVFSTSVVISTTATGSVQKLNIDFFFDCNNVLG